MPFLPTRVALGASGAASPSVKACTWAIRWCSTTGDYLDLVARDGGPSLVHERALHWGGVENHRRGGSGLAGDFDAGPDRVQVGDRCATRDKDEGGVH